MNTLLRIRLCLLFILICMLSGCAMVQVQSLDRADYIAMRRGDILTGNHLSQVSLETLQVIGFDENSCNRELERCFESLTTSPGLTDENRLATLSELWMQQAILLTPGNQRPQSDEALNAFLESARHAYAYLFFSERTPGERAFKERQTQVRDYYNYSVQMALTGLFTRYREPTQSTNMMIDRVQVGNWLIKRDMSGITFGAGESMPLELHPASSLHFVGLRSTYRRDGFGAELVAVMDQGIPQYLLSEEEIRNLKTPPPAFSEMSKLSVSALLRFQGNTLEEVLSTHHILLVGYDPYQQSVVKIHGQTVPLAANFTAGYGLWLARSDFASQSWRTVLGRAHGISRPHIYMMQPYDPNRRVVLMLHGLASSPEAWVNVANEVMGDEMLRKHFQVWQVYYPTNIPIAVNHRDIRNILMQALQHVDPNGTTPSSSNMVLVGHSMGGIIARLMVSSSSGSDLSEKVFQNIKLNPYQMKKTRNRLTSLLYFEPVPAVTRAIFIATPHSGTSMASNRLARWVSNLIKLPEALLRKFDDIVEGLPEKHRIADRRVPNSIDNLRDTDPFIRTTASLSIGPNVTYHSIIARRSPDDLLEKSDDGIVPYSSAHLPGTQSEKIIISGHSVQETPRAILEIRRILHTHLQNMKEHTD